MLGIGRGESYVIKQSGLWIQRDHTLDPESVLLADGVKGRVLIIGHLLKIIRQYFKSVICIGTFLRPARTILKEKKQRLITKAQYTFLNI
jgi:hypothetical protein